MGLSSYARRTVGNATVLWGVIFAVVHFYWAAGGQAGFADKDAPSLGASLYIAFIATLGLVGAGVAHGLVHPWGTRVGRRALLRLARLASIALSLGVVVGVGSWLAAGSLEGDGLPGIVITAYFLLGGVLYALLGWSRQRASWARA